MRKAISIMMLALLLTSMFTFFVNIQPVMSEDIIDWQMFHGDHQHTGYREKPVIPPLHLVWKVDVGAQLDSTSPAVKDNILYIGGRSRLWALNAITGEILWQSSFLGQMIQSTPAIGDDGIYVGTWDAIYCLSKTNGSIQWTFSAKHKNLGHSGFFIDSSPVVYLNTVYIGLNDGYLYAINTTTGKEIWEFETSAPIKCTPAIYNGRIYFGSGHGGYYHDNNFYSVELGQGKLTWVDTLYYDTVSSASIRDGIVYVGSGPYVYAMDAGDGHFIWQYMMPDGNYIESSPAVTSTTIYISGGDWRTEPQGSLYAIDRSNGRLKWSVGTDFTRVSPSVAGDIVYVGNYKEKGSFCAIDANNGNILWTYAIQQSTTSIPAIVNGMIYVAIDGSIYAFHSSSNPNASFTHIYFNQGDGSLVDLINGGVARVYVDQPASVNFTIYNPGEYGAYLYITLDSTKSDDYWLQRGSSYWQPFIWRKGISSEGTYTYHAKLWWNNNGTIILQDSKDITIVVSQRPPGYDLSIKLIDQSNRPIAGALISIKGQGTATTANDGFVHFHSLPAGTYDITAKWKSAYNPTPVTILTTKIVIDKMTSTIFRASVYDAELQLVSPLGNPITGAEVSLAGVTLGWTGVDGKVVAPQVPSKHTETDAAYPATAMWLGVDVSPGPVTITASKIYILTASNVASLTVQVVGAQGQGLNASEVEIRNSAGTTVFSGVSNEQGIVNVEVPYDTYSIHTDYKGFTSDQSITVSSTSPAPLKVANSVFIEIFGQAMTFATFVLWIIVIVISMLTIIIVIHRYRIWRHKRLPQQFGAPKVSKEIVKPICPKCGFSLERRGEVFWCSNCIGWIAPKDVKWV